MIITRVRIIKENSDMALDLEAYHKDIEDERRQDEERAAQEANQAAWEAKPFYSKAAPR